MRILHFGRSWSDHSSGGIERHVDSLLTQLALRGIDCVNLVANDRRSTETVSHNGYQVVKATTWGQGFRTALAPDLIWQARLLHGQKPFDVVHAHFPDPLTHLALSMLPASLPKVITWHSEVVPYPALQKLYLPLLQATLRSADAVIVATPAHLRSPQIPSDLLPGRCHVIPYGMDMQPYALTAQVATQAAQIRSRYGDAPLVFALGRHVAYKGFDVLIRSMVDVPQAQLVLGGIGPMWEKHLALVQELGLSKRVHMPGRLADGDLPAYYHACDVFCLPSVGATEAFGLVQLEAMACGKPVVCTQMGNGVNDVNLDGVTGLAVARGDPAALAMALVEIIQNKQLAYDLGLAALQRAHQCYSLAAMVEPTVALYHQLSA